uniref:Uncharacterized protein n=1 Tax=Rhizophora mucronata TaxID=61149 RepID=A0A2P2KR73_RHIMU
MYYSEPSCSFDHKIVTYLLSTFYA